MERFNSQVAQNIVERLPRNRDYITIQGETLHLDCFSLDLEETIEDFSFIQVTCVLGAIKHVILSTWRIILEWGFDNSYP